MEPTHATVTTSPHGIDRPLKKFKRRAAQACISCRARKVRCDVVKGGPCTNCTWDQIECVVRARRPRRSPKQLVAAGEKSRAAGPDADASVNTPSSQPASATTYSSVPYTQLLREIAGLIKDPCTRPSDVDVYDRSTPSIKLPSFIRRPRPGLSEAALTYLDASGAFELPSSEVQEALINTYLNWVQPLTLITNYRSYEDVVDSHQDISLSVYLGMLFAGSIYAGGGAAATVDCGDWGELARHLFSMNKALYSIDYEHDKLARIQSTLLLSLSTGSSDSVVQSSSYWLSTAVSLAEDIGLHRTSSLAGLSAKETSLRKRVWWACVMRDAELSLATCSTPRIFNHGMPMLSLEDFEGGNCFEDVQRSQIELTIQRARLSSLLLETLAFRYSCTEKVIPPDRESSMDKMQTALASWFTNLPASCSLNSAAAASLPSPPAESSPGTLPAVTDSDSLTLQRTLLHLQYHATLGALVRPTTVSSPDDAPASFRDAATNILKLSSSLYQQGRADRYLSSSSAAMTVHALLAHTLMQSATGTPHQGPDTETQRAVRECIAMVEDFKKRSNGLVSQFAARYLESRRENASTRSSPVKHGLSNDQKKRLTGTAKIARKKHAASSPTPTSCLACSPAFAITTPLVIHKLPAPAAAKSIPRALDFPITPSADTSPNTLHTPCSTLAPSHIPGQDLLDEIGHGLSCLVQDKVSPSPPNSDTSVFECLNMDSDAVFDTTDWMELSSEDYWMINDVEQQLNPGGSAFTGEAGSAGVNEGYAFDAESLLLDPGLIGL